MKLKKAWLLNATKDGLEQLGFKEIRDSITGANGLFIKRIRGNLFLTLGFTISNLYESKFTASFYLSKSTRWASVWGDIPKESYQRLGRFLSPKEREIYLSADQNQIGMIDSWWQGDENGVQNFIKVVDLVEERFLNQDDLISKIELSKDVKELADDTGQVIKLLEKGLTDNNYQFLPTEKIDNIPIEWFKAAEIVLKGRNGILNSKTVISLAADAWRLWQLNKTI